MTPARFAALCRVAPNLTAREAVAARDDGIAAAERWLRLSDAYDGVEAYNARVRAGNNDSGEWFVALVTED